MTEPSQAPVRRVHLIFDLERGRLVARDFLRELNCDAGQGWLFGKPSPPDEIARLVAAGGKLG